MHPCRYQIMSGVIWVEIPPRLGFKKVDYNEFEVCRIKSCNTETRESDVALHCFFFFFAMTILVCLAFSAALFESFASFEMS